MITIAESVPHRTFLTAMLARHYPLSEAPTVLIATDSLTPVADTIARVILITDHPGTTTRPTLVIGTTAAPGASHARLSTAHPAELLSLIDGYLRHPERFPAGTTKAAAKV